MMRTIEQDTLPPVVTLNAAALLGGPSLIVTAGTIRVLPAAPRSVDFSSYNVLSAKLNVAGLDVGDVFVLAVDTQDPESGAGAPIGNDLGRTNVITATTNGNHAETFSLAATLSTLPFAKAIPFARNLIVLDNSASANDVTVSGLLLELTRDTVPGASRGHPPVGGGFLKLLTPVTDYWQGGWGSTLPDFSEATQVVDGDFTQSPATMPGIAYACGYTRPTLPGTPTTGWTFHVVARKRTNGGGDNPVIGADLVIGARQFTPNPGWTGAGGTGGVFVPDAGAGPFTTYFFGVVGGGIDLTLPFVQYDYTISPAMMATLLTDVGVDTTWILVTYFVSRTNLGDGGTADTFIEIDRTWFDHP